MVYFKRLPVLCIPAVILVIALAGILPAGAQEFGRFSPGIEWKQINTPDLRVIFPKGLESQANRVANTIRYINGNSQGSVGFQKRKLDLVLNNQGTVSNGWVTIRPFRSEFYTTPLQDGFSLGSMPWLDLLSLHEYRHALQYSNLRYGWTRVAWMLFGDSGWGTVMNLTTPGWFFEGDAVVTETALTKQGRGRLPSFLQLQKSIQGDRKPFSYMKARNGSYRDNVPDAYELGYLLCSFGRENFGNLMWADVIRRTANIKGIIYPFSNGVEALTGMNTRRFYKAALADYGEKWALETSERDSTAATRITAPARVHTDYLFPVVVPGGDILTYKTSYQRTGRIVRIKPDGTEQEICMTGISQDPYFTTAGAKIAWTEVTWDIRYSSIIYSDVVLWNMDSGTKTYLTRKQRYYSPALSPDGTRILVAEVDQSGRSRLKILDSETGAVLQEPENPEELFYTYPKWDTDGKSIISTARIHNGEMIIESLSLVNGDHHVLFPACNQILGEVLVTGDEILFSAGFSGINNICAISRKDGSLRLLTGSRYGAYHPAIDTATGRLFYSDFARFGHHLASAPADSLLQKPIEPVGLDQLREFDFGYFEKEGGPILDKVDSIQQPSDPYRQAGHLFRVHSWNIAPDLYSAGFNLSSENTLNNLSVDAGFKYYYAEKAPGIDASVSYGGLFPILSAGVSRYYRHTSPLDLLTGEDSARLNSVDNQLSLEAYVPLDFSKGAWNIQAEAGGGYHYISIMDFRDPYRSSPNITTVNSLSVKLGITATRKRAYQNLTTPLGFGLEMAADRAFAGRSARRYQVIGDLALHGFHPNHSLVVSAGWKNEPYSQAYDYIDEFIYPRGYSLPATEWMVTLQSSYHFPLLYPDFGLAGLFYFSRIRASLFGDIGFAAPAAILSSRNNNRFASAGAELIFDIRFLNLGEVPLGVRFSYLLKPDLANDDRKTLIEFVMPILRL